MHFMYLPRMSVVCVCVCVLFEFGFSDNYLVIIIITIMIVLHYVCMRAWWCVRALLSLLLLLLF